MKSVETKKHPAPVAMRRKYVFVPTAFFALRNDQTALASSKTLYVITIFCYVTTIAVFLALFINGLNESTIETKVSLIDISDDEWTCQMMNRVTQSYLLNNSITIPSSSNDGDDSTVTKFSIYSNLYAVSELYGDCMEAMEKTQPCQHPSSFFFLQGSSTPWIVEDETVSVATYGNDIGYVAVRSSGVIYRYDLSSGQVGFSSYGGFYASTVAVDGKGVAYSLQPCTYSDYSGGVSTSVTCIVNYYGQVVYQMPYTTVSNCTSPLIISLFNDNLYQLYFLFQCSNNPDYTTNYKVYKLTSSDKENMMEGVYLTNFTSFTTGTGATSAYKQHPNLTSIYYFQSNLSPLSGNIVSQLYCFQYFSSNSTTTTVIAENLPYYPVYSSRVISSSLSPTTTDNNLTLYFVSTTSQLLKIELTPDNDVDDPSTVKSVTATTITTSSPSSSSSTSVTRVAWSVFAFFNNSETLFTTGSPVSTSSYSSSSNSYFFLYSLISNVTEVIEQGYTGTQSGWYTCGDNLINASSDASSTINNQEEFLYLCYSNGLTWSINLLSSYTFTPSAMRVYSNKLAASYCYDPSVVTGASTTGDSCYQQVCGLVRNQPPYICSHDLHQPFFTVLSTALANAHFIFVLLIFLSSSQLLPWLAKSFPPDPPVQSDNSSSNEPSISPDLLKEIELQEQHNPMQ